MDNVAQRVLLVLDPQQAFVTTERRQNILRSIVAIARQYDDVLISVFENKLDSRFRTELGYEECGPGQLEGHLHPIVAHDLRDAFGGTLRLVTKYGYGVGAAELRNASRAFANRVDVVGFETDACVLATAMRLFDDGLHVRVIEDLCDGPFHEEALKIIARSIGAQNAIRSVSLPALRRAS